MQYAGLQTHYKQERSSARNRQLNLRDILDIVGYIAITLRVKRVESFTREAAKQYRLLNDAN